jgi:small subunit ribosomal protein S20
MAHTKSAQKRLRQTAARRLHNRYYAKTTRTFIKRLRQTSDKQEAEKLFKQVSGMLDKLAKKNIIHHNKAANQKSKLARYVNNLN